MISCTICKNSGYCPFWKSEKVDIQEELLHIVPINLIKEVVIQFKAGREIAKDCKKFQKII